MSLPFLFFAISGYIIFVIFTTGSLVYGQDEELTFESNHFSIKMNYPSDWTSIEDERDFSPGTYDGTVYGRGAPGHARVAEFCPSSEVMNKADPECEDPPASVGIIMYRLSDSMSSMSPEQFANNEISLLQNTSANAEIPLFQTPITKLKILDSHSTKLYGLPAYQIVEKPIVFSKETPAKSISIYAVNSDIGYRILFNADNEEYYDTYLPIFHNMLNSFEILGTSDVQNETRSANNNSSNITTSSDVSVTDQLSSWTNYTNDRIGIFFDYPSKWELEEKQNRFETGPELQVSDGTYRFFVLLFNEKQNDILDSYGLGETTKVIEDVTTEKEDYTIIEGTDMAKYKIDGKRTGTFLAKSGAELLDVGQQLFVVENKEKGYIFGFEDSTPTFDDTETQGIMNRILHSIKFIT